MMTTDSTAEGRRSDVTAGAAGEKKYKGVRKRKWGRWVSEIRLPNSRERIWLGSYDAPEKAARAFDAASVCLRGLHSANLNFPDSPPQVSCNSRNSHMIDPQEIQAAAVSHANKARSSMPVAEPSESASTVTSASITISTMEETTAEPIADYWFFMDNMLSPAGIQPSSLVDDFTYSHFFSSTAPPPLDEPDDAGGANFASNSLLWNFN